MKSLKVATLQLRNTVLKPSQIHKLRGYMGNLFKKYDLMHNHDIVTGRSIYRYPLIQFKIIDKVPTLLAISDHAIKIFKEIFLTLNEISIDNKKIHILEKNLKIREDTFGYSDKLHSYKFGSPWIALNQKNYLQYQETKSNDEKEKLLSRILIGNILSMSKDLGMWLDKENRITANSCLSTVRVKLKGRDMNAFTGMFFTNYLISDYLGIGKSVSRGFGIIKRLI